MSTTLRFTVAEYERMIDQGVFADRLDARIELINGEIRELTPPNPPHCYVVDLLTYWSADYAPRDQVHLRVQNSLGIPEFDSVPEPDVAWMKARNYRRKHPQPRDVLLLIEVAESSLASDRGEKAELYASAKVKDYWIVNLNDWCIEVHRRPLRGKYRNVETFQIGQTVCPLLFPDIELEVASLFRP